MKYVIEHMDKRMYKWCVLEYKHISDTVGAKNLVFTNVKNGSSKIRGFGKIREESVKSLNLKNALVLDPFAKKTLTTKDCEKYDYLIFGGVLGDHPMKKRTKKEITDKLPYPARNLGRKQMSTNTAVLVSKMIADKKKFEDIRFKDTIKIRVGKYQECILPYRYVIDEKNEIIMPDGFMDFLKKRKSF